MRAPVPGVLAGFAVCSCGLRFGIWVAWFRLGKFMERKKAMEEIITSQEEAAAFLECSQRTIVRMIQRGEMPEGFLVKEGKYTKRFWTKKQLEKVKEPLKTRKEYYKKS
jgi:hypothetical protein